MKCMRSKRDGRGRVGSVWDSTPFVCVSSFSRADKTAVDSGSTVLMVRHEGKRSD